MEQSIAQIAIKAFLREIRSRLNDAAQIAIAADACASAGNTDKAIEIALDIEQISYEAQRLLDAASLLNRLSKES